MDKLPPELLNKIFILLNLDERLTCVLVCRGWWNVLDKQCLLYSIEIKDEDKFNRFIDMIQQWPHRAAHVQKLVLDYCITKSFDKRRLCNMFPNVRCIDLATKIAKDNFSEFIEIIQSKSKVEFITESKHIEYTSHMITSDLCGRLKYLQLDLGYKYRMIIPQLKNMPVLEDLILLFPALRVTDLEILHTSISSIKNLELYGINLLTSNIPIVIVPTAPSLVTFSLDIVSCDHFHTLCRFYQYVSKKYVNVADWEYSGEVWYDIHEDEDVKQVYENGYLPFLQLIGPALDKLDLMFVPDGMDVFQVLDKCNSQIKAITLKHCQKEIAFQYLAQSKQSNYVQDLSLYQTDIGSPHNLRCMTTLTTLDLYNSRTGSINLSDYFNACPSTLRDLSVHSYYIEVGSPIIHETSIENLKISYIELTRELGEIISTCFPKLIYLELYCDIKGNVNIAPQNPHFQKAKFYTRHFDKCHIFSFRSANDANPRLYYCYEETAVPLPYIVFQDLPMLSFECFIEQKLDMSYPRCIKIN